MMWRHGTIGPQNLSDGLLDFSIKSTLLDFSIKLTNLTVKLNSIVVILR